MAKTGPVRFKRVAAAFNEASRATRLCESSGSEHYSPDSNSADLSDLDPGDICSFSETKDMLESLLGSNEEDGDGNDRQKIRKETEVACGIIGERSSLSSHLDFKRGLMSHLRERGFDAGLCKSKWDKLREASSRKL
ncbi:DUF506 FAMILY PROTEIN (DUF506) [Salix purpurea]|uniref:DUF506 FAMILY PROTEIN (DUF506) n=1 Tax=Salix purpurea TaxID=77065 RepID=A0A9Q0WLR6_SALPP|nr:DUF506 FAMILY PROTEIN (DUF506) [Salix purpurea]